MRNWKLKTCALALAAVFTMPALGNAVTRPLVKITLQDGSEVPPSQTVLADFTDFINSEFSTDGEVRGNFGDQATFSVSLDGKTDPFFNYAFNILNLSNTALEFAIFVSSPYSLGPYSLLTNTYQSSVVDGDGPLFPGDGRVDVTFATDTAQLDGVNQAGASFPNISCSLMGPADFTAPCFPSTSVSQAVASAATGTYDVILQLTLSPRDRYKSTGRLELSNPRNVPEPCALALLGAGLAGFLLRRRRTD